MYVLQVYYNLLHNYFRLTILAINSLISTIHMQLPW